MDRQELLTEIKSRLQTVYRDRLRGVVLFGSCARGEETPESDIDILVLLTGPVQAWTEIKRITEALYPLQLELDRTLAAIPADAEAYFAKDRPLYQYASEEGVLA
jgi:uncharacterized protein